MSLSLAQTPPVFALRNPQLEHETQRAGLEEALHPAGPSTKLPGPPGGGIAGAGRADLEEAQSPGTLPVLVSREQFEAKAVINAEDIGENWQINRIQYLKTQHPSKISRPLLSLRHRFTERQWKGILEGMLQQYDKAAQDNPALFLPLRGHTLLIYDGAYLAQTWRPSEEEAKVGPIYTLMGVNARLMRRDISMATKLLALRHEAEEASDASHDYILMNDLRYIQTLDRQTRERVFAELKLLGFAYRYVELLREATRWNLNDEADFQQVEDRIARFIARSIREGDDESARPIHFYPALCRQIVEANKAHDLTDEDGLRFLAGQVRQQPRINLELTTLAIFTNREVVPVIERFFGKRNLQNDGMAAFDRVKLEEQLELILSRWNAAEGVPNVFVDYEGLALVGDVLYIPVIADGTQAFVRYFHPRSPPYDQASFKWSVELNGKLSAEFLLHKEFVRATLSRSRYKAEFLKKALQSLSDVSPGERMYIARGDLDFLKKLNNLYGDGIMNAVLAEIHLVMSNHLEDLKRRYGLKGRFNLVFGGDECSNASPPCSMTAEEITQAMNALNEAIWNRMHRKYGVAALKDFSRRFEQLYPRQRQEFLEGLSKLGATLELDERRAGNLIMFKLENPDDLEGGLKIFTEKVNQLLSQFKQPPVKATYHWLKDGSAFLDGYLWTPTLSLGVVEIEDVLEELYPAKGFADLTEKEREQLLEHALFRAEDGLGVAKETRNRVVYGMQPKHLHTAAKDHLSTFTNKDYSKIEPDPSIPEDERDNHDPRIHSEAAFRRDVYQSILDRDAAKLIEVKSVYKGPRIEKLLAVLTNDEIKELRGADKGVGLKAINDYLGHEVGDVVIKALADAILEHLPQGWYVKVTPPTGPPPAGAPPQNRRPLMMRFVDNVRIHVVKPDGTLPTDGEVGRLLDAARPTFNENIHGITVEQLTANVVDTRDFASPGVAFEKLQALGALRDMPERVLYRTPGGNLVKNYSPLLEEKILDFYEDFSFESAQQLLDYAQTADQKKTRAFAVEESVAQHLSLNFNSPEFAKAWDAIAIGSSNEEFYRRIRGLLPERGARVIDLATGTGKGLLPIADKLEDGLLVGMDISPAMLEFAREKFSKRYPHLTHVFLEADAQKLAEAIPDELLRDFDAVVSRFFFNFAKLDVVLPQVHDKLCPGGGLVFNVFGGFYWGNSPEFWERNPFEQARAKAAKEVLEEELLPRLTRQQREELIEKNQIRPRATGGWEIVAEPVTQDRGLDEASLRKVLRHSQFEGVVIEPVAEMYPAEERQKSALLTASIPYYWTIWNTIGGDANRSLRLRFVEHIWDRMPREFRTGEHLFTDIFVSARKPQAGLEEKRQEARTTFLASAARYLDRLSGDADKRARVPSGLVETFFRYLTVNPETFIDFYKRALVTFKETPLNEVYRDYGQEMILEMNRGNLFAFLEPALRYILQEKPDLILIIDYGARPFEEPLRAFLSEFQAELGKEIPIRFLHVSAQTKGHDLVDVYRMLKDQKADLKGKHLLVIDDNVVRLKTGPAIDKALRAHGAGRVSYFAVTAFNRKAAEFVDLATVRLPGDEMWVSLHRGLVAWSEWEEAGEKLNGWSPEANRQMLETFKEELATHRQGLLDSAPPALNPQPLREPLSQDEVRLLRFVADSVSSEGEFLYQVESGNIQFSNPEIREIIQRYSSGALRVPSKDRAIFGGALFVKTRNGSGKVAVRFDPELGLRTFLRQYLLSGEEGVDLLANPQIVTLRIREGDRERGLIRLAHLSDPQGAASLLLERVDPDGELDVDPADFIEKTIAFFQKVSHMQGKGPLHLSGRDIDFSKLGAIRDLFNARFKSLPDLELPGRAPLKALDPSAPLTGLEEKVEKELAEKLARDPLFGNEPEEGFSQSSAHLDRVHRNQSLMDRLDNGLLVSTLPLSPFKGQRSLLRGGRDIEWAMRIEFDEGMHEGTLPLLWRVPKDRSKTVRRLHEQIVAALRPLKFEGTDKRAALETVRVALKAKGITVSSTGLEELRLLLVDDDIEWLNFVQGLVTRSGLVGKVVTATNVNKAIQQAQDAEASGQPFDAAIIDLELPAYSVEELLKATAGGESLPLDVEAKGGLTLIHKLNPEQRTRTVPILLLSGGLKGVTEKLDAFVNANRLARYESKINAGKVLTEFLQQVAAQRHSSGLEEGFRFGEKKRYPIQFQLLRETRPEVQQGIETANRFVRQNQYALALEQMEKLQAQILDPTATERYLMEYMRGQAQSIVGFLSGRPQLIDASIHLLESLREDAVLERAEAILEKIALHQALGQAYFYRGTPEDLRSALSEIDDATRLAQSMEKNFLPGLGQLRSAIERGLNSTGLEEDPEVESRSAAGLVRGAGEPTKHFYFFDSEEGTGRPVDAVKTIAELRNVLQSELDRYRKWLLEERPELGAPQPSGKLDARLRNAMEVALESGRRMPATRFLKLYDNEGALNGVLKGAAKEEGLPSQLPQEMRVTAEDVPGPKTVITLTKAGLEEAQAVILAYDRDSARALKRFVSNPFYVVVKGYGQALALLETGVAEARQLIGVVGEADGELYEESDYRDHEALHGMHLVAINRESDWDWKRQVFLWALRNLGRSVYTIHDADDLAYTLRDVLKLPEATVQKALKIRAGLEEVLKRAA